MAAVFSLPFISLSTPVQAQVKPCQGTGTDSAVQSPVEIDRSVACPGTQSAFAIHYPDRVGGTLLFQDKPPLDEVSEHDDVRFIIGTGGSQPYITYGGQRYNLNNVHFHGHAEHKFAGQPFAPLEAHFVHERATEPKGYVVFSVLIDARTFQGLSQHDRLIKSPPALGESRSVYGVDLGAMLPDSRVTYRYTGSLTTPDETGSYFQPVNWVIFNQHAKAHQNNIQSYKSLWGPEGNRRELQENDPEPNIYSYH
ncbi:carbonic anhydrase family protein [Acrocarpospora pleiomorpha]|uniref:carbonic anhydrase family protein n=1 Tax=Acrocarpospora pleiomorpha TaxID=90975 RepID=UPI00147852AE|nr:carbonic anhydrase family protein [Acrocarpospora pleiomorpha]